MHKRYSHTQQLLVSTCLAINRNKVSAVHKTQNTKLIMCNNVNETEIDPLFYLGGGGDGEHESGHSGTAEVQQATL